MGAHKPQLIIIGIDGGSYPLVRDWMAQGELPTLGSLAASGSWGCLQSVVPPLTPPAWTSLMTGKGPGAHGVFDFIPARNLVTRRVGDASECRAASMWRILCDAGMRVAVFNVPWTTPPEIVDGCMIGGQGSPRFDASMFYPPELYEEFVQRIGTYQMWPPPMSTADFDDIHSSIDKKSRACDYLLSRFEPDVFMMVFSYTDWVQHLFWSNRRQRHGKKVVPDIILYVYQLVDQAIARLLEEWAADNTYVLVVSDHGATGADMVVNLDIAFEKAGLLAFQPSTSSSSQARKKAALLMRGWGIAKRLLPRTLIDRLRTTARKARGRMEKALGVRQVDWSRTVAVPWGAYGLIRINLQGREPQGIVPAARYESVRRQVREVLLSIVNPDSGEPVFAEVLDGEQVYEGPYVGDGPDLVAMRSSYRYAISTSRDVANTPLTAAQPRVVQRWGEAGGIHDPNGIIFLAGPGTRPAGSIRGASLLDIAPTALCLLGQPVPDDMQGKPLVGALTEES